MAGQCKTFLLTAPRCLPLLPPLQNYMEQPASGWAHNSAALAVGKGECAIARFIHALMAMNGVDNDAKHRRVLTKNMSIARFMWPRLAWPTAGPQLAHSWPTAGPQLAHSWPADGPRIVHGWLAPGPRLDQGGVRIADVLCVQDITLYTRVSSTDVRLTRSPSLPFFLRVRAGVYYSFPVRVSDPGARKHPGNLDLQPIAYAP
jgi:hypothetical protein